MAANVAIATNIVDVANGKFESLYIVEIMERSIVDSSKWVKLYTRNCSFGNFESFFIVEI